MKSHSTDGLSIVERPHWKTAHPDRHYTTHIRLIDNDILLTYYRAQHNICVTSRDQSLFQTVLQETGLENTQVYLLRDLSHVAGISYVYKKQLTQLLYRREPYYKAIVFFNIHPEFLTTVETFASLVPESTPVLLAGSYSEALQTILDIKAGIAPAKNDDSDEDKLRTLRKKEFISATARIGWMNMLNLPINMPGEDEPLHPYFRALEYLQSDLRSKAQRFAREKREKEKLAEQNAQEKIILINAQKELNNQLKARLEKEKALLCSRIAAQDMELKRISTAASEKTATLRLLREEITGLEIDTPLKNDMLETCSRMIENNTRENPFGTELTAADSAFLSALQRKHPNLNQRELQICLLITMHCKTGEIAQRLGVSKRGLESLRYGIHKKIGLSKHRPIKKYLAAIAQAAR